MNQTVYIGGDASTHEMKKLFKEFLTSKGVKFVDLGLFENDTTDFAVIQRELDEKVASEEGAIAMAMFGKKKKV